MATMTANPVTTINRVSIHTRRLGLLQAPHPGLIGKGCMRMNWNEGDWAESPALLTKKLSKRANQTASVLKCNS